MGFFAQSPPKAHAEQENTNQPLCLLLPPVPLWPLDLQWQATAPNLLMNQANISLYRAQNTTEQSSSAPQGFLRAGLWPLQQLSTEFRHGTAVRKGWECTAEWWEPGKRQTGDAALANASQALGRVSMLCPGKPPQRAWSWFFFPQREKKTCRRREKQRSLSGNERARTEEH